MVTPVCEKLLLLHPSGKNFNENIPGCVFDCLTLRKKKLSDSLVSMLSAPSGLNGIALEKELKPGKFKAYWDNKVSHLVQTWFSWITGETH